MSIILMSEVGGKPSILLMKMVVITSMVVRFTLKAASKKKGLKKVVAKVMRKADEREVTEEELSSVENQGPGEPPKKVTYERT